MYPIDRVEIEKPKPPVAQSNARVAAWRAILPRFRVGIGATLSVAFLAVAILAAAANLISERGLDVIAPEPVPLTTLALAPSLSTETTQIRGIEAQPTRSSDLFLEALDRFDRAVQVRAMTQASDADLELRNTSQALRKLHGAESVNNQRRLGDAAINAYTAVGMKLVQASDDRRAALSDYSIRYDAMRARARTSIDHSWKIFGRVVARQSLITLNRQIEELGTHSAALVIASDMETNAADEAAIAATLATNERGLSKSQGKEWVALMRDDLVFLSSSRANLLRADGRKHALEKQFAQMRASLTAPVATVVEDQQSASRAMVDTLSTQETGTPASAPISGVPFAIARIGQQNYVGNAIIAWISGGVLLLLVVISAMTVRSVVGPVGRLVKATARLAEGQMDTRVQGGGIKELDTLAIAFNTMAERLAQAEWAKRDYQQQLEAKVEKRTEQLKHLASNDPLTSLPNQRQLFLLLNQVLASAAEGDAMVGVYFLDIDNFKNINDGMGHAFGDKVLMAMAQRLHTVANEFGFAARLGGDEFTVVNQQASSFEDIREAGARLVSAFHEPLIVDSRELSLSVSVGASVYPDHERTPEGLLRAADAALFRAKALGRSQLSMYSPDLLEAATAKFAVEQGLRRALEKGEFQLVFQPELRLVNLEVEVVEALIRWRQPDGRLASPGDFLAVAEESGLIMDISDWVLRSAVETAARWHHGSWPQARVAINVSSRQVIDSHFVDYVKTLLNDYRLPPRCIEIELTETVLQTGAATLEALRQLRAHGIAIALDDFGTGYSSLASLQQLPLTRIKLDRGLINDIDTSSRALAIARSIISLSRSLGLQITAEGIERSEQLALLVHEGDMCLQGYLFSHPLAEGDLIAALSNVERRSRQLLAPNRAQLQEVQDSGDDMSGQLIAGREQHQHKLKPSNLRLL